MEWYDSFVVKSRKSSISIVYPCNTINAYANAGGKSLYGFNSSKEIRAEKVSFLRPMFLSRYSEPFFRWIHQESIPDAGYVTDLDLEDYHSIEHSSLIIIPGHSEYWSLGARKSFDRFVASGKNALILSGNTMWWQVRYNKTRDQMICFRYATTDPVKSLRLKTINWYEPTLQYPITSSIGVDFRNAGYGLKQDRGWDGYKIVSDSPLLQGTSLLQGDILKCPSDEMDGVPTFITSDAAPVIDYQALSFLKTELVGYDVVSRGGKEGYGTWIVFKAFPSSGIVINTASTDWCSNRGIGSNRQIQIITRNMIRKLLNNEEVFSPDQKILK